MTEFLICLMPILTTVFLIEGSGRLGRVLRDRRIDREIDENTWSAS